MKTTRFETKSYRGRTLDQAKLDRWMKMEGISLDVAKDDVCERRSKRLIADTEADAVVEEVLASNRLVNRPVDQRRFLPACLTTTDDNMDIPPGLKSLFDWTVVDVIGSPRLGRLIGALTVEACYDVSFLDLATDDLPEEELSNYDLVELCNKNPLAESEAIGYADEFTTNASYRAGRGGSDVWLSESPRTRHNSPTNITSWIFPLGSLQNELYPFPQSSASNTWISSHRSACYPTTSLEWTESECRAQFRGLARLKVEETTQLVASMASIAFKYESLSKYQVSEKWYRCMVTAAESMPESRPSWILASCLGVVRSLSLQGRHAEARLLHQDLHEEVQRRFGPYHSLVLLSKSNLAMSLESLGKHEDEEKVHRELLQSRLTCSGPTDHHSLTGMHNLGLLLKRQKKFLESEQLLMTVVDLRNRRNIVFRRKPNSDTIVFNEHSICLAMLNLADLLNIREKHTQNKDLLEEVENRFPKILQEEGRMFFNYRYQVARTRRLTGELNDSEEILRDLLKRHEASMSTNRKVSVITELAEILCETDRLEEASLWFERRFTILLENVGLDNLLTKLSCKRVGLCYAEMGQYDKATLHFERMVERMLSEDPRSIDDRGEYIQEINGSMSEVDEMHSAALGAEYPESGDTTKDDAATEDSSEEGSITLEIDKEVVQLEYLHAQTTLLDALPLQ